MGIGLLNNIASLQAQRRLDNSRSALDKVFERLATGLRINHADDDPAGLGISSSINASTRILTQAVRNVNDSISALNINEGSLNQLKDIVTRQMELAEQAANGTYSVTQRKALNVEANALVDEFNRIVRTTSFNGKNLLDGSNTSFAVQAGENAQGVINLTLDQYISRSSGTGSFASATTITSSTGGGNDPTGIASTDFNGDGTVDFVLANDSATAATVILSNSDGTLKAPVDLAASTSNWVSVGDVNGDGNQDFILQDNTTGSAYVFKGNGNGTFLAPVSYNVVAAATSGVIADFNGDGFVDYITGTATLAVILGNGNGTFKAPIQSSSGFGITDIATADVNNDGKADVIAATGTNVAIFLGTTGTPVRANYAVGSAHQTVDARDINQDGYVDIVTSDSFSSSSNVFFGLGDGTFGNRTSYSSVTGVFDTSFGDFNGDGLVDIIGVSSSTLGIRIGNGDGTFTALATSTTGFPGALRITLGDINKDGVTDLAGINGNTFFDMLGNSSRVSTVPYLYLLNANSARQAIGSLTSTMNRISQELSYIGSAQSRLSIATNNIQSNVAALQSAYSRIVDADVAQESAELVRQQILQQAAASILAQANQQPALAITLLGDN